MSNQKNVTELIKSISGQANIIAIPRIYIDLLDGDINAAMLLSQIVYWSDRSKRNDGWFYKSFVEWYQEIGLTQYKIKRATSLLEEKKIIETKLKRANSAPTIHYKLDFELLTNLIIKFLDNRETSQSDYEETSQSLTEITQEITTNNNSDDEGLNPRQRYIRDITKMYNAKFANNQQIDLALEWLDEYGHEKAISVFEYYRLKGNGLGSAIAKMKTSLKRWKWNDIIVLPSNNTGGNENGYNV